ncbi:hypothetical protein [Streptomyces sp. NPDC007074]|uniref:hypothetical protein n=1 Tax=Streptomyces sp. NPDC007074 TaxID=3156764 RepID=UPI0033EA570F
MTVPKNQTTAAKKARAVQREAGGKHTALLASQVCGEDLDPWGEYPGTCARTPHSPWEPHSADRDFDIKAWRRKADAEQAAEDARRAALTPEERAEEDERAREWEYDEMRADAASEYPNDDKYYGDED